MISIRIRSERKRMMTYHKVSEKYLKDFKKTCDEKGIKYETEAEYEEAARNLVSFVDILVEIDMKERSLKKRLEKEPKGFAMDGKGRSCSLCSRSVYETDGWYDKWGFKCMNCQDAINKKKIPGSLCGDWKNKKYVTDSTLSFKSGLHIQTIRKLIRNGAIKARQIPNGPNLILRKDNPDLLQIIDTETKERSNKDKARS
ncbi:hypothetical protein H6794_01365 [Candidatus Nomurabacteria bacterium]|nr:hypothetical protein [Candidatus Nomurabacteria bacterium]